MKVRRYVRSDDICDARQLTPTNADEIGAWLGLPVWRSGVQCRFGNESRICAVGDWVVLNREKSMGIYRREQFDSTFVAAQVKA